jgi:Holliday junction resolvasome RuvABC endonuclease subunit
VVQELHIRDAPVATCAPTTRAKLAAGSGKADKAVVAASVQRQWPDLRAANNDEFDAVALAHAGALWLAWPVPSFVYQRDSLNAITWPALPEDNKEAS